VKPRLFKKLCARAYTLCLALQPSLRHMTFVVSKDREHDDWNGRWGENVLPGTKGFGAVSGYYDPEWSDHSALWMLSELVWWEAVEISSEGDIVAHPRGLGDWRVLFQHAERLIAQKTAA
jgi:hypothetical protein